MLHTLHFSLQNAVYFIMLPFFGSCITSSGNTPHRRSEWGNNLPLDSFVSRGSISHMCFVTKGFFYGEELLASRPTPKLEDHPVSAVCDCLFNKFAATLLLEGRSAIRNPRTRHAVGTRTHLWVWGLDGARSG
jgi:hypothetical protein